MTSEEIELVELAALAAGYTISLDRSHATAPVDIIAYGVDDYTYGIEWNPIVDDGDALRLAVKLNIRTEQCWFPKWTTCYYNIDGDMGHSFRVFHESDPYAATRRAIVQAAARIGQHIKSAKEVTNVNQA